MVDRLREGARLADQVSLVLRVAVIILGSKCPLACIHIARRSAPGDHEMAVKKHWDGMPLPGLLDTKARDGVVLRVDDDHLPTTSASGRRKAGKSFTRPLFYEWRLEN